MKNNKEAFVIDFNEDDEAFAIKELFYKYLAYWPWFLASLALCIALGFTYINYAKVIYATKARVKIIDDSKEMDITSDALSLFGGGSKINLKNEIEVLRSYRIMDQVVKNTGLDIDYYKEGKIKTTQIWGTPFVIEKNKSKDSLTIEGKYFIELAPDNIIIEDEKEVIKKYALDQLDTIKNDFPFSFSLISSLDTYKPEPSRYLIKLVSREDAVSDLLDDIKLQAVDIKSDILSLSLNGENKVRSQLIINELIKVFNEDGILDRQRVSQRTLDFIDERFVYLSSELDSIEAGKENFKEKSQLSYIQADAGLTMQRKSTSQDEVAKLNTQITLSNLLKKTVTDQQAYSLLPMNIGLENSSLNTLVNSYNELALKRERLVTTVGASHPSLQALNAQLEGAKVNLVSTISVYQKQLKSSLKQFNFEKRKAENVFSSLPEKEKILRSIERQQSIKENLFLLLLQKREEAGINLAVTSPSIKVVDYAITKKNPVAPRKMQIYALSLLLGLLIPFGIFSVMISLDTKIHDILDVEAANPEIPLLAEIPNLQTNDMLFTDDTNRSIVAESFRILGTNANYLLGPKKDNKAQVIFVTSTIKGEGKTLTSVNLSLSYASLGKKTLLIGADLRNPRLHETLKMDKNETGLSDFLRLPDMNWKDCITDGVDSKGMHKVCLSGAIPPNAPKLLSSDAFPKFLELAKEEYDIIIVDTAPTILVTDTLIISQYADLTVYVTRANYTEKRLLKYSKDLNANDKLVNMGYVVNCVEVGKRKGKGYNYGYGYGYGNE